MWPALFFLLKNNCDIRTAGMACVWGGTEFLHFSFFLLISCYIYWSCTWMSTDLSLCSCSTMRFWTQYIPCHLILFQSLYLRLSLSLPLTVAIWALDPVEILWQAYLRGQRKRNDIVLQQIHGRDVWGTTRNLEESVLKGRGDTVVIRKIYGVWCDWRDVLFAGYWLGRTRRHFCGRKPNQLWFTPPHHLAGGCPCTQPLQKMYCEV